MSVYNQYDDELLNEDLNDLDISLEDTFLDDVFTIDEEEDDGIIDSDANISMTMLPVKKFYLPPETLLAEYDKCVELGEPTPKMIQFFFRIAQGVSVLLKLKSSTDINSCIVYAVSEMWEGKWKEFDEDRSKNIFSLYTTILLNSMRDHKNILFKKSYKNIQIDKFC